MSEANSTICPQEEIAAYLDGELESQAEIQFEQHLTRCETCAGRLNEQKRLLCALNFAFDDEKKFELPENFARTIVVRAESNVSGLRESRERSRAAFLIALFLIGGAALVLSGSNTFANVLSGFLKVSFVIAGVLFNFRYDFGVGAAVILRVATRQIFASSLAGLLFAGLLVFAFVALSRLLTKYRRVVENQISN